MSVGVSTDSGLQEGGATMLPADGSEGPDVAALPAAETASVDELVTVERPYRRFERRRAAGSVQASVEDEALARWNVGGTSDPLFISNRPSFHPGARVVVDVVPAGHPIPTKGAMTPARGLARVTAQARKNGYWPFRLCFEEGLRQDPRMSGRTEIAFTLGRLGNASAPRLLSSRLDRPEVAGCLVERAAALVFVGPLPKQADLVLSIGLWPGDAPVFETLPPSDQASESPPPPFRWQALWNTARDARPALGSCYRKGLVRDPGLWGRLELLVTQHAQGKVDRIAQHQSRFPDREVASCVMNALRQLPWPATGSGRESWVLGVRMGRPPSQPPTAPQDVAASASAPPSSGADSPGPPTR